MQMPQYFQILALLAGSPLIASAQWDEMVNFPLTSYPMPNQITEGPDGNLWYTLVGSAVGKLTPSGVATEYSYSATSGSSGITVGPDKALWFTIGSGEIGA
jgi:streptogramin lyase